MNHIVLQATDRDLATVLDLFKEAIQFQKQNNYIGWESIDREFIESDIRQGLLYKVLAGENMIGVFCVCYVDHLIWRDREKGDALYLHRIVLNRQFQGVKIFPAVLSWAIAQARARGFKYVRMDTWAENAKLINYYKGYGFRVIENYTTEDTMSLPVQHRNLHVALLEFEVR